MHVLVTGAAGFAGSHLVKHLIGLGHTVFGLVLPTGFSPQKQYPFKPVVGDLLDPESLLNAIKIAKAETIYHLAGQADVGLSWRKPGATIMVNTIGTVNLLEAAIAEGVKTLVAVTSAELYGPQPRDKMPITAESLPNPWHPYAVSKLAAGHLLSIYQRRYESVIRIIEARPFNHIGPGQATGFVVPDFAKQIAEIRAGHIEPKLRVGNLDAERDFTDVRDVVRAYALLAEKGEAGKMYHICSGQPVPIHTIVNIMAELANITLEIEYDPERMRPSDTPVLYGSFAELKRDTGWSPEIHMRQSLAETLTEWDEKVKTGNV
ncbi:MAG: GDP-4-dehydro-6-deoxy-D-mannose reductase [Cellvibrionaceae bacterium]|jgi:GDP-4-dehydro-6-deoxy-D-mannose reductase